jgi:hypothetical protein
MEKIPPIPTKAPRIGVVSVIAEIAVACLAGGGIGRLCTLRTYVGTGIARL